ncbi:MAG: dTDP-4-dehydrorhamnose 3,5-epimerase family protein [Mycoplasmatales bacterium]
MVFEPKVFGDERGYVMENFHKETMSKFELNQDNESKIFGKWNDIEITCKNKEMMYISPILAHGFIVMSETTVFNYKCTQSYDARDSGIHMIQNN